MLELRFEHSADGLGQSSESGSIYSIILFPSSKFEANVLKCTTILTYSRCFVSAINREEEEEEVEVGNCKQMTIKKKEKVIEQADCHCIDFSHINV